MSDPSLFTPPSAATDHPASPATPTTPVHARSASQQPAQVHPLVAIVPGLRWMVGLLIAALVIVGLYFGREILIPLALAVLLGFLLDPAVTRLHRWGMPRLAAALLVVAVSPTAHREAETAKAHRG